MHSLPLIGMLFCCMLLWFAFWWQYIFLIALAQFLQQSEWAKLLIKRAKLHWKELANTSWNMLHFSKSMSSKQKTQTHTYRHSSALANACIWQNETMYSKTWGSLMKHTHRTCWSWILVCDRPSFSHYWFSHIMPAFHQYPSKLECITVGRISTFLYCSIPTFSRQNCNHQIHEPKQKKLKTCCEIGG